MTADELVVIIADYKAKKAASVSASAKVTALGQRIAVFSYQAQADSDGREVQWLDATRAILADKTGAADVARMELDAALIKLGNALDEFFGDAWKANTYRRTR